MVCESICEITDSRVGAYPHTLKSGLRPPAGAYPHTKISVTQSYPDTHLFEIPRASRFAENQQSSNRSFEGEETEGEGGCGF